MEYGGSMKKMGDGGSRRNAMILTPGKQLRDHTNSDDRLAPVTHCRLAYSDADLCAVKDTSSGGVGDCDGDGDTDTTASLGECRDDNDRGADNGGNNGGGGDEVEDEEDTKRTNELLGRTKHVKRNTKVVVVCIRLSLMPTKLVILSLSVVSRLCFLMV